MQSFNFTVTSQEVNLFADVLGALLLTLSISARGSKIVASKSARAVREDFVTRLGMGATRTCDEMGPPARS